MASRNGVYPRPATFAEGYVRLRGTPGAALPSRIEIAGGSGNYVSVGTIPSALAADGTAVVRVRALIPGPEMNVAGTETASLTTSITGVNRTVEICGGVFCGGAAAEECEAFRQRYLTRLAYKPRATSAWIKEKLLEWPCATRVCTREGACCRCLPECDDNCGCVDCGSKLEYYVMFDGAFDCGIPPANVVNDIRVWLFGEHQGYGEGQVEVGVCGNIISPIAIKINLIIDIAGCPTSSQKEQIISEMTDFFKTVCPSMPITGRQLQLIVANVVGADVNSDVRVELVNPATDARNILITECCGDIEPECDYLPCLNKITFTPSEGGQQGGCS